MVAVSRLVIKHWWNRLGDNVFQVIRALHVALYLQKRVLDFPVHTFLNVNQIELNPERESDGQVKGLFDNFKPHKCGLLNRNLLKAASERNHEKVFNILKPIFKLKTTTPYTDKTLHIYMRSGDLFGNRQKDVENTGTDETLKNRVLDWCQPPLDFYVQVIKSFPWEEIIIVCEDRSNPNVDALIKLYPNIKYKQNSLHEDIQMLLNAVNVTHYGGNFLKVMYLFSDSMKRFYCFGESFENKYKKGYETMVYDAGDYYDRMGKWTLSKSQLRLMTEYKLTNTEGKLIQY
jgi:hypothetical protein